MHQKLIIGGELVTSDEAIDVINPAHAEAFATCAGASTGLVDRAVQAARKAFPSWSTLSTASRQDHLAKLAHALSEHSEELAKLITLETGKPLNGYAGKGGRFEVQAAMFWLNATAQMGLDQERLVQDETSRVDIFRKPIGVVGSITPWNWPLMIAVWHVAPALLTGNCVVLKPSSLTPLATAKFVEIANEILPPGVLNLIVGDGGLGASLAEHRDVGKVVFTGSTPTGRSIMRAGAGTLKRLTLELGGNDAGVVLSDADVAAIAPAIFGGSFSNSGQTCAALKRLYVAREIYDDLSEALHQLSREVTVGDGTEENVDFGPVQNASQLGYVRELADTARNGNVEFLVGSGPPEGLGGYFYPLTFVRGLSNGSRLVDEEQFGPILPIIPFDTEEEAIAMANDNPNGLGGSVWSQDVEKAALLANRLECGTAWVNGHGGVRPDVPFGGVKQSGIGVEFGLEGLREYTTIQAVHLPPVEPSTA